MRGITITTRKAEGTPRGEGWYYPPEWGEGWSRAIRCWMAGLVSISEECQGSRKAFCPRLHLPRYIRMVCSRIAGLIDTPYPADSRVGRRGKKMHLLQLEDGEIINLSHIISIRQDGPKIILCAAPRLAVGALLERDVWTLLLYDEEEASDVLMAIGARWADPETKTPISIATILKLTRKLEQETTKMAQTTYINCNPDEMSRGVVSALHGHAVSVEHLGDYAHNEHPGEADWGISLYRYTLPDGYTARVASTNGDPVWEDGEQESPFMDLLKEYVA